MARRQTAFARIRTAARSWFSRCATVLRSAALDRDLDDELQSHLEMAIEDHQRRGLSATEAREAALRSFGGVTQVREQYRLRRGLPFLEDLRRDVAYALRQMRRAPGFTAVVVVTLALGIGANTALFSIVNAVLLHAVGFPQPDELLAVDAGKPNFEHGSISWPNFRDWQRENHCFTAIAVYRHTGFLLTGTGESERIHGDFISSDLFSLLGVRPALGRLFAPGEDEIGSSPVALIGAALWQRRYGSSPAVLGRPIRLDGRDYTIVGVIPAGFHFPLSSFRSDDVYVPMGQWLTDALKNRGAGLSIHGLARLRPGVTLAQAQAEMSRISARLAAAYPEDDKGVRAVLTPLRTAMVGQVQPILLVLLGAVGFVLLIACVNVANLMLARSQQRAQEFAVRVALGASRGTILRQLMTECLLLALAGGAAGLALAAWGARAALRLAPSALPVTTDVHLSPAVLAFTLLVSCGAAVLCGVLPAWRITMRPPLDDLKDGGRTGSARHRLQDWLVISEMAIALVLLAGAGLMVRTLVALDRVHPGFDPNGVLTFSLAIPNSPATSTPNAMRACLREVEQRILAVPGVRAVSLTWAALPMTGSDDESLFWLSSEPKPASFSQMHMALRYIVEPGYLKTMQIPLLRGRFLTGADRADAPPVVVIDEDLAHRYFGDADPVGKVLNFDDPREKVTIVGEVGHVMQWGLDNDAGFPLHAEMYVPLEQISQWSLVSPSGFVSDLVLRADNADTIFPAIRQTLRAMNPGQVAYGPATMTRFIAERLAARRFSMMVLGVFAVLALTLASVGLYGVISYLVGQRTREMAIRMALGADRRAVLAWVIRRGLRLSLAGTAAGLLAALLLTRLMVRTAMTYGVGGGDPPTLLSVAALLLCVALAACWLPAQRAASADPMEALRAE